MRPTKKDRPAKRRPATKRAVLRFGKDEPTTAQVINVMGTVVAIQKGVVLSMTTRTRDANRVLWETVITRIEEPKKARRRTQ